MTKRCDLRNVPLGKRLLGFLLLAVVGLSMMACSPTLPAASTATLAVPTQPVEPPTATPEPSPTPQSGKVLLVAPAGSSTQAIQPVLAEQAAQAGLKFEMVEDLQPAGVSAEVKVVVLPAPPANLNDLLAAGPQAQFVVVSSTDLQPASNLSVIRQRPENQAFVAGFVSTLLYSDWRAAGLLPSDGPLGASLLEAYVNGGRYFCGMCAPGWPLGVYYPQVSGQPASADGITWQTAAVDMVDNKKVEVFYLASEAMRPELVSYLQGSSQFGNSVLVVSDQPPVAELQEQWAASVRFDVTSPLRQLWPDLSAGKGGAVVDAELTLENVNADYLTDGRLRLVNELLEEMKAGRVHPFNVPLE